MALRLRWLPAVTRQGWTLLGGPLHRYSTSCAGSSAGSTSTFPPQEVGLSASDLHKLLQVAAEERAELKSQLAELSQDVKALQNVKHWGARNLLERQMAMRDALLEGSESRPTQAVAVNSPNHICQMDNTSLAELAEHGHHAAHVERLVREIMKVDKIEWEAAQEVLAVMDTYNERYYWLETLPYRIGITAAFVCGTGGYCMVFDPTVAFTFGTGIAREELPDGVADISEMTVYQIGSWTWGWMEPLIGTGSFILLCVQFMRAQMYKMNMSPYTEAMLRYRANRLADRFPQYDRKTVRQWAKHLPAVGQNFFPTYRRHARW